MDVQSLQNRMTRLLDSQKPSPEHTDYSILNYHMRLLEQIALMENSSMTIYDILQKRYVFVRNRFRELIDYDEQAAAEQGYAFFFIRWTINLRRNREQKSQKPFVCGYFVAELYRIWLSYLWRWPAIWRVAGNM